MIVGKAQMDLASSLDSLGYKEKLQNIIQCFGIEVQQGNLLERSHQAKLHTRNKHFQIYNKKLEMCLENQGKYDEGLKGQEGRPKAYKSGINAPKPNKNLKESKLEGQL
jgi:hypothetical protein